MLRIPTVRDLIRVTRPVCFQNEDDDFPYSMRGSCVLLQLNDRIYAVTAGHIHEGEKPSQFMFPYEVDSNRFLPMCMSFNIKTDYSKSKAHEDILIFEIWRDKIQMEFFNQNTIFDITSSDKLIRAKDQKYFISGFPNELQDVDYEGKGLRNQACQIEISEVYEIGLPGIKEFKFSTNAGLASFSGFSGGGVFSLIPQSAKYFPQFEGILLQATSTEWMIGRFLQAELIREYILKQQSDSNDYTVTSYN